MLNNSNYVVYIEMTKDTRGAQLILTPPMYNSLTDTSVKTKMFARKISKAHPRPMWNIYWTRGDYDVSPRFMPHTAKEATQEIASVLQEVNSILVGYVDAGWKMTKEPIVLEMSYEDQCDVEDSKTPAALVRRIARARAEAGYPSTVWPEEKPTEQPPQVNKASSSDSETLAELQRILAELDEYEAEYNNPAKPVHEEVSTTTLRWGNPE